MEKVAGTAAVTEIETERRVPRCIMCGFKAHL